jgi:tetratricopeptide (TPR) repeat protein
VKEIGVDRLKLSNVRSPRKRIPLLNSIALACQRSEAPYAVELLREALSLSESAGNQVVLAQTNLNIARWLGHTGSFEEAFQHLLIAKTLFQKLDDKDALIDVQLVNAMILLDKGDYTEAYNFADLVYQYRRNLQNMKTFPVPALVSSDRVSGIEVTGEKSRQNNELKLANATRVLAMIEASRMNYFKALSYLDENFELWQHLGETQEAATAMNGAGLIYARIGENARAIEFFQRALAIYRSRGANINVVSALTNLGNIRRVIGDYSAALENLNEAWHILADFGHPQSEIEVALQFAKYYIGLEDYGQAYAWAAKSLEIANERGIRTLRSEILSFLGQILYLLKRFDEAILILSEGLQLAEKSNLLEAEVRSLKYLYLSMKDLGRIEEAFSYLERFQSSESALLQHQLGSNAKAIQERYAAKFALTSDAVYRAENNSLTMDVERLTKELSRVMRQVRKKDEVLGKLKKDTSEIINYSQETQSILKPIINKVNEEFRDAHYEKNASKKLQEVQTHFIRALRQRYPALSKAEVKICSLLHLEMSSAEIASFLNISIRTVENHRSHIRQKLHLDENQSIQEILENVFVSSR